MKNIHRFCVLRGVFMKKIVRSTPVGRIVCRPIYPWANVGSWYVKVPKSRKSGQTIVRTGVDKSSKIPILKVFLQGNYMFRNLCLKLWDFGTWKMCISNVWGFEASASLSPRPTTSRSSYAKSAYAKSAAKDADACMLLLLLLRRLHLSYLSKLFLHASICGIDFGSPPPAICTEKVWEFVVAARCLKSNFGTWCLINWTTGGKLFCRRE